MLNFLLLDLELLAFGDIRKFVNLSEFKISSTSIPNPGTSSSSSPPAKSSYPPPAPTAPPPVTELVELLSNSDIKSSILNVNSLSITKLCLFTDGSNGGESFLSPDFINSSYLPKSILKNLLLKLGIREAGLDSLNGVSFRKPDESIELTDKLDLLILLFNNVDSCSVEGATEMEVVASKYASGSSGSKFMDNFMIFSIFIESQFNSIKRKSLFFISLFTSRRFIGDGGFSSCLSSLLLAPKNNTWFKLSLENINPIESYRRKTSSLYLIISS